MRFNFPKNATFLPWLSLATVLAYQLWVLLHFGLVYTDSDQVLMWLATVDYSNGIFHEPRFYGQNYNTMLEALMAAPLYVIGVPVQVAVPVMTKVLALVPFAVLFRYQVKAGQWTSGGLVLVILLLLPIQYDLITSMSRGFVTGIALVSLNFLFLSGNKRFSFAFLGFSVIMAYSISGNSVLLSIPIITYYLTRNYRNRDFYLYGIIGFIIGGAGHVFLSGFYWFNPDYVLHRYDLNISFDNFRYGVLLDLKSMFNNIVPVFWGSGWVVLVLLMVLIAVALLQKTYKNALVVLSGLLAIILTLFLSKSYDGTNSIFFSVDRMYLAIPVMLAFFIGFCRSRILFVTLFLVSVTAVFLKSNTDIRELTGGYHVVHVMETEQLMLNCAELQSLTIELDVDLIVFKDYRDKDLYTYGCVACIEDFPNTVTPGYDRRRWRLLEDEARVYRNILILDQGNDLTKRHDRITTLDGKPHYYLLPENEWTTKDVYDYLDIPVRSY